MYRYRSSLFVDVVLANVSFVWQQVALSAHEAGDGEGRDERSSHFAPYWKRDQQHVISGSIIYIKYKVYLRTIVLMKYK